MASSDGLLRMRYFLFRLLIDRIRQRGMGLNDASRLVDAYLDLVPRSQSARLVLAELLLEEGHWQPAVAAIKLVLAEHSVLLLPQQILVALYRQRHDPKITPVVDGVYIGDLKDRFCHVPFDELMTDSAGSAWTCCPSFLPVPIGNIYQSPW
ncbi:MAG: hypothetical protein NTX56_19565, partial [Proteobacteria bacterium]|nr:hypothetical protein [Pseudomonadota bacterium]